MTCLQCAKPLTVKRENVKYDASGLPGITLENVEVRRCRACGEYEIVIPKIEELHSQIAHEVIHKPARLTPHEIRFLRKSLGWSGADFAKMMGTTAQTISRWETGSAPMGIQADRLLRVLVARERPVEEYTHEDLLKSATVAAKPSRLRLTNDGQGWRPRAA